MTFKKSIVMALGLFCLHLSAESTKQKQFFDYSKFEKIVLEAKAQRDKTRLTEKQFLSAMKSDSYILLDARSHKNFLLRHLEGAKNLPLTEFTEENLKKVIPTKKSKILIYCNNNFTGSPISFASKMAPASLNITTQVHLRAYGYDHIYELEPTRDVKASILPFVGQELKSP